MTEPFDGGPWEVRSRARSVSWEIDAFDAAASVGDNKAGFPVPAWMDGWRVSDVLVAVHDKGVTGALSVALRRRRNGSYVDVLSTNVTVGDEYFARDGVINTGNMRLQTGDLLVPDVDAVHSGTPSNGFWITVTVEP